MYTSVPLEYPLEVTGVVTVTLYLETDQTDGAFYIYLEDVSLEGDVNLKVHRNKLYPLKYHSSFKEQRKQKVN